MGDDRRSVALAARANLWSRCRCQAAGEIPRRQGTGMMQRTWMAPLGLHIEPAQPRDADAVAKLHAASFYRGWPRQDIESYLLDSDTPTLVACDAKRKLAGFAMLRL